MKNIDNMNENELLAELKRMLEESNKIQMEELFAICLNNRFLSSDFILSSLMEILERNLEEDEIDEHMKGYAKEALQLLYSLHKRWYGW